MVAPGAVTEDRKVDAGTMTRDLNDGHAVETMILVDKLYSAWIALWPAT